MQGDKQETSSDKLLAKAKDYLARFGYNTVLRSNGPHDLRSAWGSDLGMTAELYPLVVKLAEKKAAKFQQELVAELREGAARELVEDTPPFDDEYEGEFAFHDSLTREERSQHTLALANKVEAMTPREFSRKYC